MRCELLPTWWLYGSPKFTLSLPASFNLVEQKLDKGMCSKADWIRTNLSTESTPPIVCSAGAHVIASRAAALPCCSQLSLID
eukprot:2371908-Amphidinium_carterae.1